MLEVALVMPVFLLMIFGAMQFAIVLFGYCNGSYAVRNAARYASVHSGTSMSPATVATVQQAITPLLWMGAPVVTVSWPSGNTIGAPVRISLTQTYSTLLPFASEPQLAISCSASRIIVR